MKKLTMVAFAAALAAQSLGVTAHAQDAAALAQAKMFFNAGAQAYERGQYAVAIQAFEAANKLAPRPPILFAIAQAYRKQWTANKQSDDLRRAVQNYRDYVAAVKEGARRDEAVTALEALDPDVKALERAGAPMTPMPPPKPEAAATRIMVSSQTANATVALDGAAPGEAPLIADVTPGKHRVKIAADGFFEEEHDIVAVANNLLPFAYTLREKPALVTFHVEDGAEISVDGRLAATTPLARPLELPSGTHLIAVTKSGYKSFSQTATLEHGGQTTITVRFERTTQRVTSYAFLGVGAATVLAGGVFTILSFTEQSRAQKVLDAKAAGNIDSGQIDTYSSAVDARDRWKTAATITFGAGAALLATGAVLYFFDRPSAAQAGPPPADAAPKPASPPPKQTPSMEMGAAPMLGPGTYGAAVMGRF
jgi:hypothetical protein